ncbi:zinc finger, CCHC-type, Retrotransposon gag domain protein [Artemisia annua]|uniref:Zinc finger, CCHC-type, Retrotransposon gag domain protein n=1 Tax=Artemisia annua TaxID=35608 RepID=A0A2U1P0I1_ARTAN|nr:zinc finger, CCHC-type, Retrotransposon gag domain protein [Artemisia annua]
MVNTRRNGDGDVPDFEAMINAALANALPNLSTELRTQITNDIRNGAGTSGGGGGAPPTEIHVWIERFNKLKPLAFRSAATPTEAEDWITHMEKLFQVLGCADNFKTRLAAFKLEGGALSWWKAHLQTQMVNTRRNGDGDVPDFEAMINAALANALPNLSTELRTQITNDIRNGAGTSGGGGGAPPTEIHVWIERFNKLKPLAFRSAATPTEAEDWITHMEKLFQVLGCADNFKTRLAAFKLEGGALSWWKAHLQTQQRYEREYGSIYQLDKENSGDYMQRFMRLVSFVGPIAGDAQRQARHFKWGLKRWILDRIVNNEYADVAQVCTAARNIELLHESGNSNKRDRDGNCIQNKGQGQQEYRSRSDQGQEYKGQTDRRQEQKDQAAKGNQQGHYSDFSSQQKPVEALPPPPLYTTCGKSHPGPCFKATGGCFSCGSISHKIKDCPKKNPVVPGNYIKPTPTTGRVYSTTREDKQSQLGDRTRK